jgi:hypothetical protein
METPPPSGDCSYDPDRYVIKHGLKGVCVLPVRGAVFFSTLNTTNSRNCRKILGENRPSLAGLPRFSRRRLLFSRLPFLTKMERSD